MAEAEQNLLPLDELAWFKDEERTCYWVWVTVANSRYLASPDRPVAQYRENQRCAMSYHELQLKTNPSSSKERFGELVKFFDRVDQPLKWQQDLLSSLKNDWTRIYTARKPFTWLEKNNEEQIRWAWEYLNKDNYVFNKPRIYRLYPTCIKEMYLAIYAAFDSWDERFQLKRLFLNDFNKAWQQKKHRDSRQGKKVCNLVLREEVKQKLDDMAAARGMKLNQFVETLIENEHAKTVQLK